MGQETREETTDETTNDAEMESLDRELDELDAMADEMGIDLSSESTSSTGKGGVAQRSIVLNRTLRPHSISFRLGWGTGHDVKLYFEDREDLDRQLSEILNAGDEDGILDKIEAIKARTSKEGDR